MQKQEVSIKDVMLQFQSNNRSNEYLVEDVYRYIKELQKKVIELQEEVRNKSKTEIKPKQKEK